MSIASSEPATGRSKTRRGAQAEVEGVSSELREVKEREAAVRAELSNLAEHKTHHLEALEAEAIKALRDRLDSARAQQQEEDRERRAATARRREREAQRIANTEWEKVFGEAVCERCSTRSLECFREVLGGSAEQGGAWERGLSGCRECVLHRRACPKVTLGGGGAEPLTSHLSARGKRAVVLEELAEPDGGPLKKAKTMKQGSSSTLIRSTHGQPHSSADDSQVQDQTKLMRTIADSLQALVDFSSAQTGALARLTEVVELQRGDVGTIRENGDAEGLGTRVVDMAVQDALEYDLD
ncbi:hypothetical protein DFP72DRAFT_868126 [Ephemerocybe angulata]|uniref:Uncharacterized protein n=1 Tax=Ephemerocybe angulata TaxID=980116 RepID=A0A8H6IJQ0_9AGAR|nr:hypothetical protein DFP72DRAFT_868126 [Tulosesus angulatus]